MVCKYRSKDSCSQTQRLCFRAQYDEFKKEYIINSWQEKACPNYDGTSEEISSKSQWNLKEGDEYKVLIRIFGIEPGKFSDEEGAAIGRSIKEDAEVLEALLNRRYAGGIKVEGIDIRSERMQEFPEVKNYIEKEGASLVGMINDEIRFIDDVPLPLIKMEIEKRGMVERAKA